MAESFSVLQTYRINEALCFYLVYRNLENFKQDKMEYQWFTCMRGLVVSLSFLLGIPEPWYRDVENKQFHASNIYIIMFARGTAGGRREKQMLNFAQDIQDLYDFQLRENNPSDDIHGILSEKDVFDAHFILSDFFVAAGESVQFGVLNFDMLSSAVARQSVSLGNKMKWNEPFSQIATLTFGLVKNHAFNDGNKRTALLCMIMGLHRIKRCITCKKNKLEILLVRIAANEMYQYEEFNQFKEYGDDATIRYISKFLRKNSRKTDYAFRAMTFEEFNRRLRQYGVWLAAPSGAYINVYKQDTKNILWGLIKRQGRKRIAQIAFPGWKRQIDRSAFKKVMKEAGLTPGNGVDMKTFYEETTPEYKLMEEYFDILTRLKDR